jgi:hypothetical protein
MIQIKSGGDMANDQIKKESIKDIVQQNLVNKIRVYQNTKSGSPDKSLRFKELVNTFLNSYKKYSGKLS